MQLQFQGAARTVTGSMHVLTAGGRTVLLDCVFCSFSGHAGRNELLRCIAGLPPATRRGIFLVHGDADQAEKPGAGPKEAGFPNAGIPAPGDEVSLV